MKSKHLLRELLEKAVFHPAPGEAVSGEPFPPGAFAVLPPEEIVPEGVAGAGNGGAATVAGGKKKKVRKSKFEQNRVKPVEYSRAPLCRHFGVCGGCEYQHVPYARQLHAKVAVFQDLAARQELAEHLPLAGLRIVPSPCEFGYRQRMDYVYAFGKAGLRERGSHKHVVTLEECPLLGERGFAAFRRAVELAEAAGLPCYSYLQHEGFLRYFVVRQTREQADPGSGQVLLALVTKSRERPEEMERIAQTLLAEGHAQSVYWLLQETISDVSFGEPIRFWGAEWIEERYAGKSFRIGPNTFFQANPGVAEQAYARIAEYAREVAGRGGGKLEVVDAYSGTGVIAQLIAAQGEGKVHVAAVENVPDNVRLARENLRRNGIADIELHEEDAGKFLAARETPPDLLVVNPPRTGLGQKAVAALRQVGAPAVAYMSCNPVTLLEDLRGMLGLEDQHSIGSDLVSEVFDDHKPARRIKQADSAEAVPGVRYRVTLLQLYDMFPQTRHWETLAFLERVD